MAGSVFNLGNIGEKRRAWEDQAKEYCNKNNITDTNTRNAFMQAYKEMRTIYQYGSYLYGTSAETVSLIGVPDTFTMKFGADADQEYNYNVIDKAAKQLMEATGQTSPRLNNLMTTTNEELDKAVSKMFLEEAQQLINPDPDNGGKSSLIIDPPNDPRDPDEDPYVPPVPPGYGGGGSIPTDPGPTIPDPDTPTPPIKPPEPRTMTTAELNDKWHWLYSYWHMPPFFNSGDQIATTSDPFGSRPDNNGMPYEWIYGNLQANPYGKGKWFAWEEGIFGYDHGCPSMSYEELETYIHKLLAYRRWKKANPADPIFVDLDSNGIELTSVEDGAYFDFDANHYAEKTAFANFDDGMLVIDKNSNSYIDDGSEVFSEEYVMSNGENATSSYEALADLDSNSDGVIDINDPEFANIKVLKGDGTLMSLEEAGIKSLNLTYTEDGTTDENGNIRVKLGSYTDMDDVTHEMLEFMLDRNLVYNNLYDISYKFKGNYSLQRVA